jgi:hypothetical protein
VYAPASAQGSRDLQLDFIGNEVVDSGQFRMLNFDPSQPVHNLNLSGNRFWDSTAAINTVNDATIIGNRWYGSDGGELSEFLTTGNFGENVTLADNLATVKPALGDATLDGLVDREDVVRFASNYGRIHGANWSRGDFDFDGRVTLADLAILRNGLVRPASAAANLSVPEPSGLLLLGMGLANVAGWLLRRGLRRSSGS